MIYSSSDIHVIQIIVYILKCAMRKKHAECTNTLITGEICCAKLYYHFISVDGTFSHNNHILQMKRCIKFLCLTYVS